MIMTHQPLCIYTQKAISEYVHIANNLRSTEWARINDLTMY